MFWVEQPNKEHSPALHTPWAFQRDLEKLPCRPGQFPWGSAGTQASLGRL